MPGKKPHKTEINAKITRDFCFHLHGTTCLSKRKAHKIKNTGYLCNSLDFYLCISTSRRRKKPLRQSNECYRGQVANLKGTECRAMLISVTK